MGVKEIMRKYLLLSIFILVFSFSANAETTDFYIRVAEFEDNIEDYHSIIRYNGLVEESNPVKETEETYFLEDLLNSYLARYTTINRYKNIKKLTEVDYWLLREICILSEENFYNKYSDNKIFFENIRDKNLCNNYLKGLKMQYDAVKDYKEFSKENTKIKKEDLIQKYIDGCILRENVLAELNYLYNLELDTDIFILTKDFSQMFEEAKNEEYPYELVLEIQTKLNELGYDSGIEDGILGNTTIFAIFDYQRDLGLEINGKITDEMRAHLQI